MLRLAALLVLLAAPAFAQSKAQTLADIRAELNALGGQLAQLRAELTTTGAGGAAPVAGSALDRMNAMESELARLTAKTEDLQLQIKRVVSDGTNRLGDLEFRICELEKGCDVSKLGSTAPLGGDAGGGTGGGITPAAQPPAPAQQPAPRPEMAVGEERDFDKAKAAFDGGDFRTAADLFATYADTYPGGAMTGEALYWRGEALMSLGDTANAARSWLKSFSDDPKGNKAPDSLLKLGLALNALGQAREACVTLGEVPNRYPGTQAAADAMAQRSALSCL